EKYTRELEARTAELEALQSFNRQLRGPLNLEELAKRAVYLAIQMLYTDYGALYLTDSSDSEKLNLLGGFQHPSDSPQNREDLKWSSPKKCEEASCWPEFIRLGQDLPGEAAQPGKTVQVQNLAEETRESTPTTTLAQSGLWQAGLFI